MGRIVGVDIKPLSNALGARISNLNLENEIPDSDFIILRDAFLKYHLLK